MPERLQLTDDDIRSALDTAARIGDDALQRASQGRVVPDSFTHGSQRAAAGAGSTAASSSGDPDQCDTFSAATSEWPKLVNLRTARKQRDRAEARRDGGATARAGAGAAEAERRAGGEAGSSGGGSRATGPATSRSG